MGAGLFTAHNEEHDWGVAHRTLVPAFGPIGIKDMYDEMYDIATQLVAKWARKGSDEPIMVAEDFTRLALDSIALCAMDKRFNSFYTDEMHPFVGAMVDFLLQSGLKSKRTRLEALFNRDADRRYQADIDLMKTVAQDVIAHRRANPSDKKDLLNAMLFGKDPKTGERLTDENIMNNMLTFLIAGHETTASLLSFACYYLLKNPEAFHKAQQEVDQVVGKSPVKFEHMSKLPYIEAIMRETLRLQAPAPVITMQPVPGTQGPVILAGSYTIPPDAQIGCLLGREGLDPVVYGSDAAKFKPERMYKENFTNLPPNAWKPFGNGARGCIGRPFAWQESIITLALILQNFNLRLDDPSYQLKIRETLTIKPNEFRMKATLREGIDAIKLEKRMHAGADEVTEKTVQTRQAAAPTGAPMTILYGSNSGTCEGLAQSLASTAGTRGIAATVKSLDAAVDQVPQDQPVIIITASYEGNPPDNAAVFVEWLKGQDDTKLKGTSFGVFGCGHRDWVATYQKVPQLIESEFLAKGGKKIIERGETNVAAGTIFDDFDAWADKLWPLVSKTEADENVVEGLDLELSTASRASHLRHSVQNALVIKNELLTAPGVPEKRHVEVKLPSNTTYEAGDYLALLPINNVATISRILRRFHLPWDATMKLKKGAHTTIPTDQEISVTVVLGAYVELNGPATRKNIATLAKFGGDEEKLTAMTSKSIIEMLEKYPSIELPFAVYLSMLQSMRIRQYSISSSPLKDATTATITYSVVDGDGHLGVATNYLRNVQPGTTIQVAVKKSHASFHLPIEDSTPVIMVAAGTGLAPFHGFVQERATKIAAGKKLGEAVLFVGCRHPEQDKLYAEELADWESKGVVKVYYAFSQAPEQSSGCRYAQDRMWHERQDVMRLFSAGARAYICGSAKLGKGVADAAAKIAIEAGEAKGESQTYEKALAWWEGLRGERYAVDVFD